MISAMAVYCPDVPCEAPPAAAYRWYKNMEPRFSDGELIPWIPNARNKEGQWARFRPGKTPPGWHRAAPPETRSTWKTP